MPFEPIPVEDDPNFKYWDFVHHSADLSRKLKIFFNKSIDHTDNDQFHSELQQVIQWLDAVENYDEARLSSNSDGDTIEENVKKAFDWLGKNFFRLWV